MDETSEELIIEEKGQNVRFEQNGNLEKLKAPKIQGLNLRYRIGDQLQLNCSSSNSDHLLPAPYLEWFVNNRRINEQYVHNYAANNINGHLQKPPSIVLTEEKQNPLYNKSKKHSKIQHLITNSYEQMPESNLHHFTMTKSSPSTKSSYLSSLTSYPKTIRKNDQRLLQQKRSEEELANKDDKITKDFQNDYLFSNNLKKLNFLSLQQRNKNNNLSSSITSNLVGQALQTYHSLAFLNESNFSLVNTFHQQTLYNNNVNLTRLQNIIYQHYADYSFKNNAQNRIGIRFKVMKKHYQTLDYALRVKCTATYGKVILTEESPKYHCIVC